ncbi:ABC transporter ATP-binding protein [Prolixibacter denitrificans]|uniref:ABC transporter ATP-binding protein n=3 Tax=Prolixibacter denitrificans TaxID=1541063 RepID=A0ABQ0ZLF9_9BACT|nr:ABC transporter ATP-binding protein [Prolixibacter denitrificans]
MPTEEIPDMRKRTKQDKTAPKKKVNLFALLKPYRTMVIFLVLFALLGNGANLIIPKIISHGIDTFNSGHYVFRTIAIEFLAATLAIFFFTYLQAVVQTYASEKVARDLRKKLSDKISRQSFTFIRESNPSKLLTNLTSDMDSVKTFVAQAVASIVSSVFVIIGTCVLLLTIDWKLALPVITMIPIIGFAFYMVLKRVRVLFRRSREVVDWLNKVINESILGAAIIRVVNAQQAEYRKFLSANTEAKDLGISILTLFATLIPVITFVANLATLTILALGGHYVINGSMTLGNFAAFNSYVAILIFPIIVIGFMSNVIARATASYERIDKVMKAPETVDKGTIEKPVKGNIELQNVTVSYEGKPALKNVSLNITAGSQTAIIGPTAAGKTQLLYLLTGLIHPNEGTVLFDDIPLEDYRKETFHNQIGFVFQDSVMFNLSLRENIAFSDTVNDESLEKAIETAELKEFVQTLPKKLDTLVSERGTSLSGGQKQRIMLARALALNPKILLLDDFTARVDQQTEQKIIGNVLNNYPDLTLISVTQKIAPVKHYEQIILLMEGEVVAAGKHETLLETSPEYMQIYQSQKSTSHYETTTSS